MWMGMRLLARWYKVLLPHLTSYEESPFISWVLGKMLRSFWTEPRCLFPLNLEDFWVHSHHIVTHVLTDCPVNWLSKTIWRWMPFTEVAPCLWSTCRINMASQLSLKCLSATCCLQLSTKSNDATSKIFSDCQRPTFVRRKLDKTGATSAQAGRSDDLILHMHGCYSDMQWYMINHDDIIWYCNSHIIISYYHKRTCMSVLTVVAVANPSAFPLLWKKGTRMGQCAELRK